MNMESLTQKSQEALAEAQRIAQRNGHTETDGEHLLLALLEQESGLVPRLLVGMQVDVDELRGAVEAELRRKPKENEFRPDGAHRIGDDFCLHASFVQKIGEWPRQWAEVSKHFVGV